MVEIENILSYLWNAPSKFEYITDVTPLSNWKYPLFISTGYLITIFGLSLFMKSRQRINATLVGAIHNFIMLVLSIVCFIGIVYGTIKQGIYHGFESLYCDSQAKVSGKGTLYFWLYIFYLSKYYELIDTVLLVLRKSRIIFLHVYHHWITGPLCFVCLYYAIPVQWTATALNAFVHIPMYYYYFLIIFNIRPWWKAYITQLQIAQFIIVIICHTSAVLYHYLYAKNCRSYDGYGNAFAGSIIWSYLILFIQFYIRSYIKLKDEKRKKE